MPDQPSDVPPAPPAPAGQGGLARLREKVARRARKLRRSLVGLDRTDLAAVTYHLEALRRTAAGVEGFALADSLARLSADVRTPRWAVVAILPPDASGVAEFTARLFAQAPFDVDLFFPGADAADYMMVTRRLFRAHPHVAAYTLASLDAGVARHGYGRILYVLGDSEHHLPVLRFLRRSARFAPGAPQWVEAHEARLPFLASLLAKDVPALAGTDGSLRDLLRGVPVERLIVHSSAARDALAADGAPPVDVLFHPVFDAFVPRPLRASQGPVRLGSFGVPSARKGTPLVVEAFRRIRARHPGSTLVLAGYGAARYAADTGIARAPGIEIVDHPAPAEFSALMAGVDVAVQLRLSSQGESSGVIAQLLAQDTPVITSFIGGFADYGAAVRFFTAPGDAEALATAILEERDTAPARSAARRAYVDTHSPARLCADLAALAEAADRPRTVKDVD